MRLIRGYGVNIREAPNGRIIGTVGRGGEVAFQTAHEDGWTQYRFERFMGWIKDDVHKSITPVERRHEVNWISQLGVGANQYGGDCGAACLVMLLESYLNIRPTVDEISALFGFSETKRFGFISDLLRVSGTYGLPMNTSASADIYYTAETLFSRPFIQLLDYDLLPRRYDLYYFAGHYAVVYACDSDHVHLLDPYDRQRREHILTWFEWRDIIGLSRYNNPTQAVTPKAALRPSIRAGLLSLRNQMSEVLTRVF